MKKGCAVLVLMLLLCGCADTSSDLERGMALRSKILKAEQVCFSVDIEADYGDSLQLFSMECISDAQGNIVFTVTAPETIAGITGSLSQGEGELTFDDTALHFELLTDDQLNPASAPWILMKTLRSGYLRAAGMEGNMLRLTIDDSYEDNSLQLDIWLDEERLPGRAEVLCEGRMILSLDVRNFEIL